VIDEVRKIRTKSDKCWRCINSIAATRNGRHEREDFGRQTTFFNTWLKARNSSLCRYEGAAPLVYALNTLGLMLETRIAISAKQPCLFD
jgi:hypothetical protein